MDACMMLSFCWLFSLTMTMNTSTSTASPGSGGGTDAALLPTDEPGISSISTTIPNNGVNLTSNAARNKLQILIMLPLNPTAEDSHHDQIQEWDRGLEILPGAQIAVEAINKDPNLFPRYELEIVEKSVDPCIPLEVHSNLNAFIPFAKGSLQNNTIGVLGLFCQRLLRIFSPLAGRDEFGLFQLSGTTSPLIRGNRERYTHLNFIVPSEAAYYETLFTLMRELNWKRALVIDDEFFNLNNGSFLMQNLEITHLEYSDLIFTTLNEIRRSERNIVYVSVGARRMANLLCAAYDDGLVWPHYMWILQDHDVSDLLKEADKNCTKGKLMEATQNSLVFKFQHEQENKSKELDTGKTFERYLEEYTKILGESGKNITQNKFANTMHDSVWAFAFALNHSLDTIENLQDNMTVIDFVNRFGRVELTNLIEANLRSLSFEGVSGRIQFNDNYDIEALVSITLLDNHNTSVVIGYYDQASPSDFTVDQTSINLPSDQLPNKYNQIPLPGTILLIITAVLCLLLTTIMFILFIKYRRYSEIKATSPYLSMLMFVGTYLILISAVMQAVLTAIINKLLDTIASAALCGSVISGNVMGVNLIFSTLLLRMLRIYRIFSYFGKTGKIWSDKVLVVIVLLIVGGDIVLLLIWFNVDPFTVKDVIVYRPNGHPPHYEISQYCTSSNIGVWFALIFGKVGILFAIVLFLAIKTRKIQRENFKDTKKVNIYIFITVLIVAMLIPVWFLLEGTGNVGGTGIVIYMAFGTTGVLCQLMLFAPKVLPPLLRSMGFKVGLSPANRRKKTIRRSGVRHNSRISSSSGYSTYAYNSTTDTYRRSSIYPTYTQSRSPITNSKASLIPSDKISTITVLTNLSTVE